jgi:hypothetical protein
MLAEAEGKTDVAELLREAEAARAAVDSGAQAQQGKERGTEGEKSAAVKAPAVQTAVPAGETYCRF